MMPPTVTRIILNYVFLFLVGYLDYLTGREVHLGSIYLLVVATASWNLRPASLFFYAVATVVVWNITDSFLSQHAMARWLVCWNIINRAGVVGITASMVYKARITVQHQQRLIRELGQTLLKVSRFKELVPVCRLCHEIHLDDEYRAKFQEIVSEGADASTIGDVCPTCRDALVRRVENIPVEAYFSGGHS